MRTSLLALSLLTAAACAEKNPAAPRIALNEQFTIAVGSSVTLENPGLRITFIGVTGDSRCPADVVCIQGGDAIVHVRVSGRAASADYDLHTGDAARSSVSHDGLRFSLVNLQPYPFSSRKIGDGEYRATLTVTRP